LVLMDRQDAYGHLILDYFKNRAGREIVERDDGFLDPSKKLPEYYFAEFSDWEAHEHQAMKFLKGRVLDIGCGAGRVALHLQEKDFEVLGIDVSPLAVRVCRLRGLMKVRVLPITKINGSLGKFDTILMFSNNFGLFGNFNRARWLLRRFHKMTSDPYKTKD
jgi:2-polyprenyl-3-methyl-5-hydroxy-6-metoxy-1,4-benzoquinol methylase